MKHIVTILILLLFVDLSYALNVKGSFNSKEVILGGVLQYKLSIEHDDDETISRPPDFSASPEVFVRSIKKNDNKTSHGTVSNILYDIQFFNTGKTTIFPIKVNIDSKEVILPTSEIFVSSITPTKDTDEIKDIKSPFNISQDPKKIIKYIGLFIGFILLILIIYLIIKRISFKKKDEHEQKYSKPVLSAYSEALVAIKDCQRLIDKGMLEDAYFMMSHLARRYFGRRSDLILVESTTEEALRILKKVLDSTMYKNIASLLISFDPIKYTPQGAQQEKALKDLNTLEKIIKEHNDNLIKIEKEKEKEDEIS